jgi:hypothetical protein
MKIALLISGLPRYIDQGFQNIQDSLIKPNNPDIFIHTWGDANNQDLRSKITSLFNPKILVIEPPKIINNSHIKLDRMMKSWGGGYTLQAFTEMTYSMWYSILQANLLKEQYRLENNIHYDYVIRARFDIVYVCCPNALPLDPSRNRIKNLPYPLECKNHTDDVIYMVSRPDLPPEMVDDRFAFASNSLMNIYCGGFNNIEYINLLRDKKDGIFCGETIVYEMLKMYNRKYIELPVAAKHLNPGGSNR